MLVKYIILLQNMLVLNTLFKVYKINYNSKKIPKCKNCSSCFNAVEYTEVIESVEIEIN